MKKKIYTDYQRKSDSNQQESINAMHCDTFKSVKVIGKLIRGFTIYDLRFTISFKLFIVILLISLIFNLKSAPLVRAQEVTPTPVPLTEEEVTEQVLGIKDLIVDVSENILDLAPDSDSVDSAVFAPTLYVTSLIKNNYQIKEKININVKNLTEAEVADFDLSIENTKGKGINALVTKDFVNEQLVFTINPEVGVNPGKYSVKVINTRSGEVLSTQDFSWGQVTINTNKSIYLPDEVAKISLGVLNADGGIECNALLKLDIKAPWGQVSSFNVEDGTIVRNQECLAHNQSNNPDYLVNFPVKDVGRYTISLNVSTPTQNYTVKDRFEVRDSVPFEVERVTATRLYPGKDYPVRFKIKAHVPFSGKIVESVPQDFQIRKISDAVSFTNIVALPDSYNPFKEFGIGELILPYLGEYIQTQGFGDQIDGHGMELVYKRSGIDGHDGLDFSMPEGTPIVAVDAGKVILAEENWTYGHSIVIQHSWGRTYYGHLSDIQVREGIMVVKGQQIALSGNTGLSTGPHLHFGLKPNTYDVDNLYYGKVDPAPYLGLASVDEDLSHADFPLDAKALVWNINVAKGGEFIIGYDYKAPNRSPFEYSLGQLQFISADVTPSADEAKFDAPLVNDRGSTPSADFVLGQATGSANLNNNPVSLDSDTGSDESVKLDNEITGQVIFEEIRQWQIMADSINDVSVQRNTFGASGKISSQVTPTDFTEFGSLESAFIRNQNNAKLSSKLTSGTVYSSEDLGGAVKLIDTSTINFSKETGTQSAATKFAWESWEYNGATGGPNEFRVISRNSVILKSQSGSVKLKNVPNDINKAIPFITGVRTSAKNDLGSATAIAWLSGADVLNIERGSGGVGDVTVDVVTVEFTGNNWKVSHADSGLTSGDNGSLTLVDNANGKTAGGSPIGNFEKAIIYHQYRLGVQPLNSDADLAATYAPEGENSVVWRFHQDRDDEISGRHFIHVLKNNDIKITRFTDIGDRTDSSNLNISQAGIKDIYSTSSQMSCSVGAASDYGSGIRNGSITSFANFKNYGLGEAKDLTCEIQIIDLSSLRNKLIPELSQTLRHGQWLEGGNKKGFTF